MVKTKDSLWISSLAFRVKEDCTRLAVVCNQCSHFLKGIKRPLTKPNLFGDIGEVELDSADIPLNPPLQVCPPSKLDLGTFEIHPTG